MSKGRNVCTDRKRIQGLTNIDTTHMLSTITTSFNIDPIYQNKLMQRIITINKVSSRTLELPQLVRIESRMNFYMCHEGRNVCTKSKLNSRSHNHRYKKQQQMNSFRGGNPVNRDRVQALQVSLNPLDIDKLTVYNTQALR